MDDKAVLEELRDWRYTVERCKKLEEQVNAEINCKVTANYSLAPCHGSVPANQVESVALRRIEAKEEYMALRSKIEAYKRAVNQLGGVEKEVVVHIMSGGNLSNLARAKGIYKTSVYKIQDRAVKKILEYLRGHHHTF